MLLQVLQTVMAESLYLEGEGRKTFQLERDREGEVVVHVHKTGLTVQQTWDSTSEQVERPSHLGSNQMVVEDYLDKLRCKVIF